MLKELKDMLIKDGYIVNEPIENLLEIKDYLTKEELDYCHDLINKTPNEEWFHLYLSSIKPFALEKFGRDDIENLVAEGLLEITQGWEDKNLSIPDDEFVNRITNRINSYFEKLHPRVLNSGQGSIQRMQEGVQLKSHTDQDTDPSIRYATIIYLNDDYVDGEIFWENKDFSMRPSPGTMLIFPGTKEFHHGVRHVGKGPIRYVIVGFVKNLNYYEYDREGNRRENVDTSY